MGREAIQIVFWLSFSLIVYSYFGYPLILLILGEIFGKKVKKKTSTPAVSLLIPVYNEEKIIRQKIENCLNLDYPKNKLDIIIASESTDKTNQIVNEYPLARLIMYHGREGKQCTIYRAMNYCDGEIVVLTDANGMFKRDTLKKLVRNFADPKIGCVIGQLKYKGKGIEGLYWKYENFIKRQESKLQSVLGANGSIYAFRRKLYNPLSEYRGDDFELPIRVRQQGYGVIWEPEAISEEEIYPNIIAEFKRKLVIISWHFRSALMLLKGSSPFLIFQLFSHKILRWLVGWLLIFMFISNSFIVWESPLYASLFALQLLFYAIGISGTLETIRYFCMVNLAGLIGTTRAILNRQTAIWKKMR